MLQPFMPLWKQTCFHLTIKVSKVAEVIAGPNEAFAPIAYRPC